MDPNYLANITRIRTVAQALKELDQKIVFVGGATVSLYVNPASSLEVRPTEDVDVVIELATYQNFAMLEETLRKIGFANDIESKIMSRYKFESTIVDIMPINSAVLGFTNRWYEDGFRFSIKKEISPDLDINIFLPEYLIASKIEAFKNRGENKFLFSKDFEDIVYLFENVAGMHVILERTRGVLRDYLKESLKTFESDENFTEAVMAHLHPTHASYQLKKIQKIIRDFLETEN